MLPIVDEVMTERLFSPRSKDRKHAISKMVGIMVESVHIDENEVFEHPLLRYQAKLGEAEMTVLELLKTFVYVHVITLPEVKGMEYKGQLITLICSNPYAQSAALLPRNTFMKYDRAESERDRQRVISDYIAGMTNTYASRMYEKFLRPRKGRFSTVSRRD